MLYCPTLAPFIARLGFPAVLPPAMARAIDDASRLRALDPAAIGSLHDQYYPELYRYARFRLGDPALAEDTASEAFVRLLEAVQAGRGPKSSARGWLFGTLRHMIDDHYRAHYARPVETGLVEDLSHDGGPAEAVEDEEQRQKVRAALERLTAEQQHVLALRFSAGYNLEETAGLMGRNANAVKALQFRALQSLRRALDEESP